MTDPALDPLCSGWTLNPDGTLTVRLPPGADERPARKLMAAMGYVCPIVEDMPDGSVLMHDSRAIVEIFNDWPVSGRRCDPDPEAPGGPWYDGPDRCVVDVLNRY
jgi:hypothetical protein